MWKVHLYYAYDKKMHISVSDGVKKHCDQTNLEIWFLSEKHYSHVSFHSCSFVLQTVKVSEPFSGSASQEIKSRFTLNFQCWNDRNYSQFSNNVNRVFVSVQAHWDVLWFLCFWECCFLLRNQKRSSVPLETNHQLSTVKFDIINIHNKVEIFHYFLDTHIISVLPLLPKHKWLILMCEPQWDLSQKCHHNKSNSNIIWNILLIIIKCRKKTLIPFVSL